MNNKERKEKREREFNKVKGSGINNGHNLRWPLLEGIIPFEPNSATWELSQKQGERSVS